MNSLSIDNPDTPLRILLVENGEQDVLVFRRVLEQNQVSCEITHYARAEDALQHLSGDATADLGQDSSMYDLLVTDHKLPGMTGLDLCKALIERDVPLPTVLLTEAGSEHLAIEAIKAGVNDYVVKDPGGGYLDLLPVVLPEIVKRYADHLAHRRIEDALQRRNQELTTLLSTAEVLSTTQRLDLLLERVLDELRSVVHYDIASICMVRDEWFWMIAARGLENVPIERFNLGEFPAIQQVVREGSPVGTGDAKTEFVCSMIKEWDQICSWLGVPLITRDEVIGLLMVGSCQPDAFGQETTNLTLAFAHLVAQAMESSHLYEHARAKLSEAKLLHSVTTALSASLDLDRILPYIAYSLCEILNGTSVDIYQFDAWASAVTLVANYVAPIGGDEEHTDLGQTYALADFPAMVTALSDRRPVQIRVDDPNVDSRVLALLEARGAQAMLFLPMLAGDHLLGFSFVWDSQTLRRFTPGEIALAETLIRQAAITMDHARLIATLRQTAADLQTSNEELDAFAHTVAHDLKSPLTSLIGFALLLEKRFSTMSEEKLRGNLQAITQSGQKIGTIIDELLLLASVRKMEEVEVAPLDMAEIVKEAQVRLVDLIASNQAEISLPDDWPTAFGRAPWVEEVWANYISNGIKYGGRPPRIELGAKEQPDGQVRFWVRDNGPGLSTTERRRLFSLFTQLDHARGKGHGLGLSIVQRIVEKFGGEVGVESENKPGKGCTFWFTLPAGPKP